MSRASKEAMSRLHAALAKEMETMLREGVVEIDKGSGEAVRTTPGAAYLNVVRQFLKDNGIDSPSVGEQLEEANKRGPKLDLPFATVTDEFGPVQ